jgi:hypothetical protein
MQFDIPSGSRAQKTMFQKKKIICSGFISTTSSCKRSGRKPTTKSGSRMSHVEELNTLDRLYTNKIVAQIKTT